MTSPACTEPDDADEYSDRWALYSQPAVWLVFGPRGRITRRSSWLAGIFPMAYLAFTLIRGEIVSVCPQAPPPSTLDWREATWTRPTTGG